jgi:hypothetical protein
VECLRADVARLALGVLRARRRRDRHGLSVLLICIVLFGAATFLYQFAELVMPTLFPVLHLAFSTTVTRAAAAAFLAQGKSKLRGADGALREDHLVYGQNRSGAALRCTKLARLEQQLSNASALQPLAAAAAPVPALQKRCKRCASSHHKLQSIAAFAHNE